MQATYVVVGAGAAGCTIAARLSEDPKNSVILVELGPTDDSLYIDMPGAVGKLLSSEKYCEFLQSEPQRELNGRRIAQARGRGLGGSSTINGMIYLRGHPEDYDGWAAAGCEGWDYNSVLPYFKKSERHQSRSNGYHGTSGPLGVSTPELSRLSEVHRAFVRAGESAGFPISDDFNADMRHGFGVYDHTIWHGKRMSASKAFLGEAKGRQNLSVLTGMRVRRILIKDGRAIGLEADYKNGRVTIGADREVVLCAGTYGSAQLLLLSGIGPAEALKNLGIEPVHDVPGVGENLHNHPDIIYQVKLRKPISLLRKTKFPRNILSGVSWILSKSGMGATNHLEVGALLPSQSTLTRPDLQLILLNVALQKNSTTPMNAEAFQVHTSLIRPYSRGRMWLRSSDPGTSPSFDLNFLADNRDRLAMREGYRILRRVLAQEPISSLSLDALTPPMETDAEIDDWLDSELISLQHPVGTCKMGADDDRFAVVDKSLRVRGVAGLRVADASIMPAIVAGNTYAPVVMIAERASDLIKLAQ
jgi:choline dehydrogenase